MNLTKLRGNLGWLFKLQPPAIHLDSQGNELPARDEEWVLQEISQDGQALTLHSLEIVDISITIGADVVHRFDTDRSRGTRRAFLVLMQQMIIHGGRITFRPSSRPGERVNPLPPIQVERVPVSFDFLRKTGIEQRLAAEGFEVNGVTALRLAELELKGWERIIVGDTHGRPTLYYVPDSKPGMELIFIKKRKPAPPQRVQVPAPRM